MLEALVAATLLGIGIAALVSGLAAATRAHWRMAERAQVERLAAQQFGLLVATGDWQTATSGGFEEESANQFDWEATVQPTAVEDLFSLEVVVSKREGSGLEARALGLVFSGAAAEAAP